jgi:hypothetical protein
MKVINKFKKLKKVYIYILLIIAWLLFSLFLIKDQAPVFAYTSMYELQCDDGSVVGPQMGNEPIVFSENENDFLKKGPYFYGSRWENKYWLESDSSYLHYGDKIARFVCTPGVILSIQDVLDLEMDNEEFASLMESYGGNINLMNYEIVITDYKQFQSWKGFSRTLLTLFSIPVLIFLAVLGVLSYLKKKKGDSHNNLKTSDIIFWVVSVIILFSTLLPLANDVGSNIWRINFITKFNLSEEDIRKTILGDWTMETSGFSIPTHYVFYEDGVLRGNFTSDEVPSYGIDGNIIIKDSFNKSEFWDIEGNILIVNTLGFIGGQNEEKYSILKLNNNEMVLLSGNRLSGYKSVFKKNYK